LPEAATAARIVEQGRPLSAALAQFPRVFPVDHNRLLQIAEQSGSVDATLGDLADYAAEMIAARRTVLSGLALPALVLHLSFFLAPVPGLVLGHLTVAGYGWAVLQPLALLWGGLGALRYFARRAPPEKLDAVLQRLPAIGPAWRALQRWRVASALGMLARTSLGVPASLRFAAGVCADTRVARALLHTADVTEQAGTPASAVLHTTGVLPAEVIALWRNAELTGSLDTMFTRVAARYADDFRARVHAIAAWLPRLAYGLVVLSVILQALQLAGP
jgi:general secretion pathway protein F